MNLVWTFHLWLFHITDIIAVSTLTLLKKKKKDLDSNPQIFLWGIVYTPHMGIRFPVYMENFMLSNFYDRTRTDVPEGVSLFRAVATISRKFWSYSRYSISMCCMNKQMDYKDWHGSPIPHNSCHKYRMHCPEWKSIFKITETYSMTSILAPKVTY